jgi:hypothetical protein
MKKTKKTKKVKKDDRYHLRVGYPILRKGITIDALVEKNNLEKVVSDIIKQSAIINMIEISDKAQKEVRLFKVKAGSPVITKGLSIETTTDKKNFKSVVDEIISMEAK